jgi:hypothetical protein
MEDLQCSDFRTEVGQTAIQLIDSSVRISSRRFSLFGKPGAAVQKKRERIIFAPTLDMKFDFLALMMQTSKNHQSVVPPDSALQGEKFDSLKINDIPFPLKRICSASSTSPWEYEKNVNRQNDNSESSII